MLDIESESHKFLVLLILDINNSVAQYVIIWDTVIKNQNNDKPEINCHEKNIAYWNIPVLVVHNVTREYVLATHQNSNCNR